MATAEVKHFALAKALQYDVSYISKWIGGRVLPSEKSACDILQKISHCLVENASPKGLEQLSRDYELEDPEELWQAIYDNLIAEYYYVQELQQSSGSTVAPKITFYPELSMKKFIGKINHPVLRRVSSQSIVAAIDLFHMDGEFRLKVVNLEEDKASGDHTYPNVHFSLLIYLGETEQEPIRDAMFISNMLINSSRVDFQLYGSDFAYGKVMFVVKQDFAITGMLLRQDACTAVTVCEGEENTTPLYNDLQTLCTREKLLCRRITMEEMLLQSMDYVHALLASEHQWLLGHLTEYLLPEELFRELVEQGENLAAFGSLTNIHHLTRNILESTSMQLMICESALTRFMVTGGMDFFNRKIQLDFRQRRQVIEHLRKLVGGSGGLQIRLIQETLISDFQYSTCPSVFLSETISYLRLETKRPDENLLLKINSPEMKELYSCFFREIWEDGSHVISDREEINQFMGRLSKSMEVLDEVGEIS